MGGMKGHYERRKRQDLLEKHCRFANGTAKNKFQINIDNPNKGIQTCLVATKKIQLVDAVAKVMQENQVRRDVERQVNETYGIHSKKSLPFEKHDEYDRVLAEKTHQCSQ
jgi:hypothetical protein